LKRALVTGGAGFIGSHVAELLLDNGYEVEIIDDLSSGKRGNAPSAAVLHETSIVSPDATRIIADRPFDVIVHLAAQIDVRKSVADPMLDARTNLLGTINLLESVRRTGRRPRVVFTSTGGAIYGDLNTPPNSESYPKDPESPYAISKLAAEYYLAYYDRIHRIDHVALRFGNVYGPRQDPHGEAGVVAIFCNRILERKPLTVYGDGRQTRDYVYVGDVASAVLAAAVNDLPPAERLDSRSFNIGTGVGTSVVDLAAMLLRVAGTTGEVIFAPRRQGEQQESFLDIGKAKAELGWMPETSLEEGLGKTFAWTEVQVLAQST